jgi:hypothetical protein
LAPPSSATTTVRDRLHLAIEATGEIKAADTVATGTDPLHRRQPPPGVDVIEFTKTVVRCSRRPGETAS